MGFFDFLKGPRLNKSQAQTLAHDLAYECAKFDFDPRMFIINFEMMVKDRMARSDFIKWNDFRNNRLTEEDSRDIGRLVVYLITDNDEKKQIKDRYEKDMQLKETKPDFAPGRIPLEKVLRESEKRNKIDYPFLENFPDEVYFYNR